MRILVTGAGGFVGKYLLKELTDHGHESAALDLSFPALPAHATHAWSGDLRNASEVNRIVAAAKADGCVHLGAASFVPMGQSNPDMVLSVNIVGTLNLLEAFRKHAPSARILVISSSHIYGSTPENVAISENAPLRPVSVYAISKAAADLASLAHSKQYQMHIMTARPSNHTGPGQSPPFLVPSLAKQVCAIARAESENVLHVGNLESRRDFTDVRDVVRAYRLLLELGQASEAYNISSGNILSVREILETLCRIAGVSPDIQVDPGKYRPYDSSPLVDISKLQNHTGWRPEIAFETTLRDLLSTF
jgi:GDP-4-dehydro-6-deoxy-D-mannose reductase